MTTQEKFTPPEETPYRRILRETPEGNWTHAAAQRLTDPAEILEYLREEIAETLRPDQRGIGGHSPASLRASIEEVISGPNLKTPEQRAVWTQALQEAMEESEYFTKEDGL